MKTDDLITALAADTGTRRPAIALALAAAGVAGALIAATIFGLWIRPRVDFATAATTVPFVFKFVVTLSLLAAAFFVLERLARPGAARGLWWLALLAAPALLAIGGIAEAMAQPAGQWAMLAVGKNAMKCLVLIPLMGIGPLAVLLLALRHGAPTRPALAGLVAGLTAGAIAATLYAAHCTDDSPFFVALWYTLAIAGLGAIGALAGRYLVRW